jgi:hypothetical protein
MMMSSSPPSALSDPPAAHEMSDPPAAAEITCVEALRNQNDEGIVTLKGKDGSLVLADRGKLAARCLVFRQMLFGKFSEASKSTVELGYSGDVIKAIVEYSCNDTASILNSDWDYDMVQKVVSLMDAARYFGLPELGLKAQVAAVAAINEKPSLCAAWLAACQVHVVSVETIELAWAKIRSNPQVLLEEGSISLLSSSTIEQIIKDQSIQTDAYTLFRYLQEWSKDDEARKPTAAQLIQHVPLECIEPTYLSTTVASSGLVTKEQLCDAHETQALWVNERPGCKRAR